MKSIKLPQFLFFTLLFLHFESKAQYDFPSGLTVPGTNNISSPPGTLTVASGQTFTGPITVAGDLTLMPGTTLFVSGTSLTVSGGGKIDLQEDVPNGKSVLYLRNGAQLIQNDIIGYDTGTPPNPIYGTPAINTGTGELSVYQEGVADVHQYNYWCSPVGDPTLTPVDGNYPFHISMLGRPTGVTTTIPATILTGTNYDGATTTGTAPNYIDGYLRIASYWIYKFVSSNTYGQWSQVGTGSLDPGYGFTMKGTIGTDNSTGGETANSTAGKSAENNLGGKQRYDFRGMPNNGNISVAIAPGQFTLIGNPYPSAINLDSFFKDPENNYIENDIVKSKTDGVAYFWEQGPTASHYLTSYTGGYGTYAPMLFPVPPNPVPPPGEVQNDAFGIYVPATFYSFNGDGTYIPGGTGIPNPGNPDRRYCPIGQGFMVRGGTTAESLTVKNSHRVYQPEGAISDGNGSVFSKKATTASDKRLPQIRFSTTYDAGSVGEMVQVFHPNSTNKIDNGKDAVNPNGYPVMVNFLVDDNRCVISTTPFDMDMKIPLIFDNKKQAKYKITVKEMINVDQISNVYLHDKTANVYYDIKNDFANLTLPGGMNYNQYEVTFKNNALGVDDLIGKSFEIFQDNTAKKLVINNLLQKELSAIDLYDITGKLILSKKQLGTQLSYEFSTAGLSDGIYIVRATSQDNITKAQKIIIKN